MPRQAKPYNLGPARDHARGFGSSHSERPAFIPSDLSAAAAGHLAQLKRLYHPSEALSLSRLASLTPALFETLKGMVPRS